MDLISGKIAVRSVVQHLIIGLGVIFAMVCGSAPSVSDEFTDRRITAGARIFRALLAADRDIREKRGDNGKVKILAQRARLWVAPKRGFVCLAPRGGKVSYPQFSVIC